MKILIINTHPSDALGGSEMQCDLIARGLTERRHEVIYGAVGRKRKESYTGLPYRVVSLAIERRGALTKVLQEENPDVIYWRNAKPHFLRAVKESRQNSVPFVFAVSQLNDVLRFAYNSPMERLGLFNKIKYYASIFHQKVHSAYNYTGFRYIDGIIYQLNNQNLGNIPVKKQQVIWNSVSDTKELFNWKKPYCLWVGNIKSRKQPEAYIKLVSTMAQRYPEIDFLMIGEMQDESYKPMIQKAKEIGNFHYLGFQPLGVVNGAMASAECLVQTFKTEGFPNVMIQAWMQGCPTVALEYDPDNISQSNQIGFLSGNFEQMVNDVELLLKDKQLRDEKGNRAKIFAKENFTPDKSIDKIESFLIELVNMYAH